MSSIIKKKNKSFLARVVGHIWPETAPPEQGCISANVPLNDVRTDVDDTATIAMRREELRATKHDNTDAMATFDGNG